MNDQAQPDLSLPALLQSWKEELGRQVALKNDYLKAANTWSERAELAEAQRAALLTALKQIANDDEGCTCKHDDQMCCAVVDGVFCTRCLAATTIAAVLANHSPPAAQDEARTLATTLLNEIAVERTRDAWTPPEGQS